MVLEDDPFRLEEDKNVVKEQLPPQSSQDGPLEAEAHVRKKKWLIRRPGYLRAPIRCLSPAVSTEEHPISQPRTLLTGGQPGLALSTQRGPSWCFGIHPRPLRPWSPEPALSAMDGSATPGLAHPVACQGQAAGVTWTWGHSPPAAPPISTQDTFTSSFSFIQLALGSGERGEAEGCPPTREPEGSHQGPSEATAKARPLEHLPGPWWPPRSYGEAAGDEPRLERKGLCPPAPGLSGPSDTGDGTLGPACGWDALLQTCQPALDQCLLNNQKQLQVKSLRLKLRKLQDKAVEDDDYDKAESLKQRLEDLEVEERTLRFQLPSQQPALSRILHQLGEQVQAALHWVTQGAVSEETQPMLRIESKPLGPPAQDGLRVTVTRRERLIQEKWRLQQEMEALQARMAVLEAKDEQLRKEIDEQEQLVGWSVGGLGTLPLDQLQEMRRALDDTWASATQVLILVEPPEALRSLQERISSLGLSLKEITAKLCMNERLCRTLRKKVSDIEAQLPTLLEAKMLAISGSNFCTAKDLTEEIMSLASEREALEGFLSKLLMLNTRNVRKLENMREEYNKLIGELEAEKTAY
ncbi:PREDICTED: disrupted in schizophrenia 1 protein-like, partial [Elephantulus edwardii]|uniref:disrupted in schizophrenia 1 protein-like n=1 Tax=Elephantulus edwardii TaxID=28737 RepID=UPI0003F08410